LKKNFFVDKCETVIEILVLGPEEEQLREADVGEQEIADGKSQFF